MKTNGSFSAKRLLSLLLVFAMIVGILPTVAFAAEKPVRVMNTGLGGVRYYDTLAEAVANAKDQDEIMLLEDMEGPGLFLERSAKDPESRKSIIIDLDGHTYTCTGPAVGSSGTQTQALHLEENNDVTICNGTITCTADSGVKMLVQNYAGLFLFDVTLDGTNLPGSGRYVLSNHSGLANIYGNTNIYAQSGDIA
ncbi:MAG: hypothetical protein MJ118_09360, partial [Clostridia bacterium]|nr:hypothetical protein [Clostridia bacterium]